MAHIKTSCNKKSISQHKQVTIWIFSSTSDCVIRNYLPTEINTSLEQIPMSVQLWFSKQPQTKCSRSYKNWT